MWLMMSFPQFASAHLFISGWHLDLTTSRKFPTYYAWSYLVPASVPHLSGYRSPGADAIKLFSSVTDSKGKKASVFLYLSKFFKLMKSLLENGNVTVNKIGSLSNPIFLWRIHCSVWLCQPGDLNKDPTVWLDGARQRPITLIREY